MKPRLRRLLPGAIIPAPSTDFAGLFRDAPMGVALADASGVISEANAAFAQFFGGESGRAKPAPIWWTRHDRPRWCALIARAAAGQAGKQAIELRSAAPNAWPNFSPVRYPAGGGAVLYLVDVSEQKALETKFAQSQKMQAVGQLAGGVAHDFNNLLTVIIGNCEFLLMRHPAGDPSFKEINEVHQNALRAAALVGQLLAFSRKQTMQPKTLALGDVIGELAQMLRRLLGEGITLDVEKDSDLWPVHADEAQLSNAIINLVVNARDAMPSGGTVTIRTSNRKRQQRQRAGHRHHAGRRICRDRGRRYRHRHVQGNPEQDFRSLLHHQAGGPGHRPGSCHRLWHRQADRAASSPWIPKWAAAPPSRSTCRACGVDAGAPVPKSPAPAAPRDVTGQDTILLVEDEEAVRSFAARALRMRGYNVLEASGGEEALEIVKAAKPKSIFSSPMW